MTSAYVIKDMYFIMLEVSIPSANHVEDIEDKGGSFDGT
jgi:hypothetical protein